MTKKIFRSTIFVAAVVLLSSLGIVMGALYTYYSGIQEDQLKDELTLAVTATEQYGSDFLENVEGDRFRITWISADGTVLFDTQVAAEQMENHSGREEIYEAFTQGHGSSIRYSDTLMEKTYYEAQRLQDGSVLRISASQASVGGLLLDMFLAIILVASIAILLSAVLASRMSRKIVEPLNALDLEHPLANDAYEEIYPLLKRINQQHNQIKAQLQELKRKTDEFDQITENMQEGLVLLDRDERILSINPTAKRLFEAEDNCVGKSFLTVDGSRKMCLALNAAMKSGHGSTLASRNGRDYRFDLSRIKSGGDVIGVVVLAFDVTEVLNAERNRREFSANVSHELKTPLQSIIGSAELLENGLVKPEDTSRFIGHIHKEAARLVNLIEDIIRLSQLDEGVAIPTEEVDLLALCEEVASNLERTAQERNVTLEVQGQPCCINGVRRLLHEIVYNLCDNAIKYNVPGGRVTVSVGRDGAHTVLTVSDTGIGIPPEHQGRVFERFYRVDKSHSKASGGTGLGLSIVKHAAAHHGAELQLHSVPGEGTRVTVRF